MGQTLWSEPPSSGGVDGELARVAASLRQLDPDGAIFARVLRDTLDQLLDGQRTGRYAESELRKTEKTHMGTLVEINLHRAFEFEDGTVTDYRIAGVEVDCKFSRTFGGWEVPLEAHGHLCLLVWADDARSLWSTGLIRIREDILFGAENRDRKRRLNPTGLGAVVWLFEEAPLPENLLLHLPERMREAIFTPRGGQTRVNELFRRVQRRIISRTAVLTVAQQKDAPKRVRDARKNLRSEGIIILGHQGDHPRIARTLRLPVPVKGEWVSTRIVAAAREDPRAVRVAGGFYRQAADEDERQAAPILSALREEADDE